MPVMRYLCSYLAFVSLLLFGQVYGVSHAAEYGADAHHHESVPCSAILHEDSDTPILARSGKWPAVCMQHVVPFGWELGKSASAIWAGSAAVVMGIPSIDVEAGGSGVVDAKAVEMLTEGFERILSHLGMIAKQFPAPTDQLIIFDR